MKRFNIVEAKVLRTDDLRNVCIKNNWYTCGSCEDYENLLFNLVDEFNRTQDGNLYAIVYDIIEHSDEDALIEYYGDEKTVVECVFFEIAELVKTYFTAC